MDRRHDAVPRAAFIPTLADLRKPGRCTGLDKPSTLRDVALA
jgi:hypothetical protein